jgi:phage shock protein A
LVAESEQNSSNNRGIGIMRDYERRERLDDISISLHGFPHHTDLNQWKRASAGGWSDNLKQLRQHEAVMDSQFLSSSKSAVLKGLEKVKRRLASSSDEVRIAALKEALKYGKEGFNLVANIVKNERGSLQLTAYDLLWENTNSRGKQKLLKYLSRHPEVCANYIEKVLEPSLIAMQEEHEQRRQALAQVCNTQELIRQQYEQALLRVSRWKQGYQDRSIPCLPINLLGVRRDKQAVTEFKSDAHSTKNYVLPLVGGNPENPAQSALITAKTLDLRGESFPPVPKAGEAGEAQEAGGEFLLMGYFCRAGLAQEVSTLKAQLDQQTALVKNLLPDLVLISKLFEAKVKKYLFEAQTFAKAIEQIEKALLQIETRWQELESLMCCDKSPLKLLQLLESLISEMQEHLMLLRQTVARAITAQLQIQHHYNLAKKAADYCKHRVQLDWQEGNENWARETLVRRKTYVDTATILKFNLEQQTPQLEAFKCHLFVLQSWLSLAIEMKDTLKVGSSSTSAQVAQKLLWRRTKFPYNSSSIRAELERIKQECFTNAVKLG